MSEEPFKLEEGEFVFHPRPRRRKPTRKQGVILAHLHQGRFTITLEKATELVGGDIYHNAKKYTGAILSNMVRKGMLLRHRKGIFRLPT